MSKAVLRSTRDCPSLGRRGSPLDWTAISPHRVPFAFQELHRQYVLMISEQSDTFEFCMTEVGIVSGVLRVAVLRGASFCRGTRAVRTW